MTDTQKTPQKLSDLKPKKQKVRMKDGKEFEVGEVSFEVIAWAEEKYGDLESFMLSFSFADKEHTPKMTEIAEFLYELMDCKDDYPDLKTFRRNLLISEFKVLCDVVITAINGSFPSVDPKELEENSGESSGEEQAG